jgi:hypothetical protein
MIETANNAQDLIGSLIEIYWTEVCQICDRKVASTIIFCVRSPDKVLAKNNKTQKCGGRLSPLLHF